ncbi:MAG: hypothetical protein N2234_04990 [Planctomycetota bacterium]|nr:hypothetical protein [Planctomycetota bacterium]
MTKEKKKRNILLFVVVAAAATLAYQQSRISKSMTEKKAFLEEEVTKLSSNLEHLNKNIATVRKENEEEQQRLALFSAEIRSLEEEEKRLRQKVGEAKTVKAALDDLEKELNRTEEALKRIEENTK